MKINKSKRVSKLVIFLSILAVAVLLYVATAYMLKLYPFNNSGSNNSQGQTTVNQVNNDAPTAEQKEAGVEAKRQSENKPSGADQSASSNNVDVAITSKNQQNGVLELRTTINNTDSSGKCTLMLKRTGQTTIMQEVGVQSMGSYAVCKGFDIQTAGLAKGNWEAQIDYIAGSAKGSITQTVEIE